MSKSSSSKKAERKNALQKIFGVDRCCTIYEEDEGFKLLADLSLCMYFGCGNSSESEVPKVVSVANSEDYDGGDSISDICEERHGSNQKGSPEELPEGYRKPDPPSTSPGPYIISLTHPPPPPPPPPLPLSQVETPSTALDKNADELSRISNHYESREALDDSDDENIPPEAAEKPGKCIERPDPTDIPPVVFGKKKAKSRHRHPPDESSVDYCPADESPIMLRCDVKSLGRVRRAYV